MVCVAGSTLTLHPLFGALPRGENPANQAAFAVSRRPLFCGADPLTRIVWLPKKGRSGTQRQF